MKVIVTTTINPVTEAIRKFQALDDWHLVVIGEWSDAQHEALVTETAEAVAVAQREAESYGTLNAGPWPSVATMLEDVFKEMPWHLRRQRQMLGV